MEWPVHRLLHWYDLTKPKTSLSTIPYGTYKTWIALYLQWEAILPCPSLWWQTVWTRPLYSYYMLHKKTQSPAPAQPVHRLHEGGLGWGLGSNIYLYAGQVQCTHYAPLIEAYCSWVPLQKPFQFEVRFFSVQNKGQNTELPNPMVWTTVLNSQLFCGTYVEQHFLKERRRW